jgi:microcompartment protein CcmK/EutM
MRYVVAVVIGAVAGAMLANLLIGRKLLKSARVEMQTELTKIAPYVDRTLADMEEFIGVARGELAAYVDYSEELPSRTIYQLPENTDE